LNFFLLETVNMNAYLVGTLLWIKQLWDAFTDPLVGALSDATVSPFGRRKPWVWTTVFHFTMFWILQWVNVPDLTSQGGKFAYYLIILLVFSLLSTCVIIPIVSILPDMARTEKSQLQSAMLLEAFGGAASLISSVVTAQLIVLFDTPEGEPDYQLGFLLAALIFAPLLFACPLISISCAVERPLPPPPPPSPSSLPAAAAPASTQGAGAAAFWQAARAAWAVTGASLRQFGGQLVQACAFPPFLLLVLTAFAVQLAVLSFISNWVLFAKYVLHSQFSSQWVLLTSQTAVLVGFFIWTYFSMYLGKKLTYYLGTIMFCICELFLLLYSFSPRVSPDQKDLTPLFFIMAFRGFFIAVCYIIPMSLLPEVTAMYEAAHRSKATAPRSEGLLYSIFLLAQKIAQALIMAIAGYVVAAAGYQNPITQTPEQQEDDYQPPSVLLALRLLVCVVPLPILLLSLVLVYFIPTTPVRSSPFYLWLSKLLQRLRNSPLFTRSPSYQRL
jgi:GPH family glycoside/pentoside/hexuronide:cation symporter